jgi:Tfp pilus assembly protein PilX
MKHHPSTPPRIAARSSQSGVVLIMALIMLAIIGITSSLALKSVTLGDQIGYNLRNNKITQQAAEAALRWCEIQVLAGNTAALPVQAANANPYQADSETWQTLAGWAGATTVPANVIAALGNFPTRPQCLAQEVSLNTAQKDRTASSTQQASGTTIRITVRAFSQDYTRANGVSSGGESWITSTLANY